MVLPTIVEVNGMKKEELKTHLLALMTNYDPSVNPLLKILTDEIHANREERQNLKKRD